VTLPSEMSHPDTYSYFQIYISITVESTQLSKTDAKMISISSLVLLL